VARQLARMSNRQYIRKLWARMFVMPRLSVSLLMLLMELVGWRGVLIFEKCTQGVIIV